MPTVLNKWGIKAVVSEERAAEMVKYDNAEIIPDVEVKPQEPKKEINQVSINELPNDQKFEAQGLSEAEREEKFAVKEEVKEEVVEPPKPKAKGRPKKVKKEEPKEELKSEEPQE